MEYEMLIVWRNRIIIIINIIRTTAIIIDLVVLLFSRKQQDIMWHVIHHNFDIRGCGARLERRNKNNRGITFVKLIRYK